MTKDKDHSSFLVHPLTRDTLFPNRHALSRDTPLLLSYNHCRRKAVEFSQSSRSVSGRARESQAIHSHTTPSTLIHTHTHICLRVSSSAPCATSAAPSRRTIRARPGNGQSMENEKKRVGRTGKRYLRTCVAHMHVGAPAPCTHARVDA